MAPALAPSIFNDVIGPVMRGPSSSHSAASVRIGLLIHDLLGGTPSAVELDYDTEGSLATTHESQGTDMGLYGGLLGWEADDERLPNSPTVIRDGGTSIEVRKPTLGDAHPNTYRIHVELGDAAHDLIALSTGGGMIEVVSIDGFDVSLFGDYATALVFTETNGQEIATALEDEEAVDVVSVSGAASGDGPALVVVCSQKPLSIAVQDMAGVTSVHHLRAVLPVGSRKGMSLPFAHASEMASDEELANGKLSDWAIAYECARGGITEQEVLGQARKILNIMRRSLETGLAGTEYEDRILGWQSGRFVEMNKNKQLLDGGVLNEMIAYVTAIMEAKSAMEVIVAAPTAGACATFPGALMATIDSVDASDDAAERALLAGGLLGVFIANRSSFAAEVGGCQAETGAGAAMAAGALVELAGGNAAQSLSAASQSIQNVLGLICDPVGNRVEAPCLGRNVTGAANALSCANMAMAGYDHVIPFDEVLDTHAQVSALMARELRCTGLAGLATTPTAKAIELGLTRKSKGSS